MIYETKHSECYNRHLMYDRIYNGSLKFVISSLFILVVFSYFMCDKINIGNNGASERFIFLMEKLYEDREPRFNINHSDEISRFIADRY